MKRLGIALLGMWLVTAWLIAASDKTQEAERLLKAATNTELVDGNLKAAIDQYKKVVAIGERATTAEALFRMAQCYQKLGDVSAQQLFARIVKEYSDQPVAAEARARLNSATAKRPNLMTLKKVWEGDTEGAVTRDGRWLSYVNPANGNLLLRDLVAGVDRAVTKEGSWSGDFATQSAMSKDATQIAFAWFNSKTNRFELRVAPLTGTEAAPSRRLFDSEEVTYVAPLDWSPDGSTIAVLVQRKDRTGQIGIIEVATRSLRVLKSVDWRGPSKMFFSPDGQRLAFDLPAGDAVTQRDIFVLAVDGSREFAAVVHPARDTVMGWSPDGTRLLFASDRNGTTGLWSLPVVDGKPVGAPELIQGNIGDASSLGMTAGGALLFGVGVTGRDIELASVDFATGRSVAAQVKPIQRFVGTNRWLDWSRDGRYLAYVSERGRDFSETVIAIRDFASGELIRELVTPLKYLQGLSWGADGRSLVTGGRDLKGRYGVFQIDAQTGTITPVVIPTEGTDFGGFRPEYSPDGKRVYYSKPVGLQGRSPFAIVERDLASGTEREILRRSDPAIINLSPDGRWIASGALDASDNSPVVVLIPTDGGQPRELLRAGAPESFARNMGWTPDGQGLIVRKVLSADGEQSQLLFVPIATGQPVKLDVDVNRMGPLSPIRVHPDGRRLAFFSKLEKNRDEVWELDNFLPSPRVLTPKH